MESLNWSSRSPIGGDRHRDLRGSARAAEPEPPAAAAVPGRQPSGALHPDRLAHRLPGRGRVGAARAARERHAGARRGRGDRGQRHRRERQPQSALRPRHRHEKCAGGGDRPPRPPAAAAARCRPAARFARRQRQHQRDAVVVLRAAAAGHARADRGAAALHRGHGAGAPRIDSRASRPSTSTAALPTTCASRSIWRAPRRSASAYPTSPTAPRAPTTSPAACSTSAAASTRCVSPGASRPSSSARWC